MPSPREEQLWQAVTKKEFQTVKALITEEPALVNALNSTGKTLLMRVVSLLLPKEDVNEFIAKQLDLIQFIAKQEQFKFDDPATPQSTIATILSMGRSDILAVFVTSPAIIMDRNNLAYATAKKNLDNATSQFKKESAVNPQSSATKMQKELSEKYTVMLAMVREATIRYAFKKDDASFMTSLVAAGDSSTTRFIDGTLPVRLFTKDEPKPNMTAWFDAQAAKSFQKVSTSTQSFFNHTQEIQSAQAELDALTARKVASDTDKLNAAAANQLNRLGHAVSIMSMSS